MLESKIQSQIINYLSADGWFVIKHIQTNRNGFPDLQALKDGRCIFIEVKQPGKKIRPLQAHVLNKLNLAGFQIIIATTLTQLIHDITTHSSTELSQIGAIDHPD